MTGADYAMLGFLIAIFVVSGWFALSVRLQQIEAKALRKLKHPNSTYD